MYSCKVNSDGFARSVRQAAASLGIHGGDLNPMLLLKAIANILEHEGDDEYDVVICRHVQQVSRCSADRSWI